jgi:hypothetical protein
MSWKELDELLPDVGKDLLPSAPTEALDPPPTGTAYQYYDDGVDRHAWVGPIDDRSVMFCAFDLEGDADGGWMLSNVEWGASEEGARRRAAHRYAEAVGWKLVAGTTPQFVVRTQRATILTGDGSTARFWFRGPFVGGTVTAIGPSGPVAIREIVPTSEIEFDIPPQKGTRIHITFQVDP